MNYKTIKINNHYHMKKLSILTPLKITNNRQFNLFVRCLNTYKNIIETEDVEFLIVNESNYQFFDKVEEKIKEIKPNFKNIKEIGFVRSVRKLITESTGKYIMFFLDDVEMVYDSKKICEVAIESMEKDMDIFQIKLGGGKVSNSSKTKNVNRFSKSHKEIKINDEFSVWLNKTEDEYEISVYVISQWNSMMRGDIIRDLNDKMDGKINATWDQFTVVMSKKYRSQIKDTYTGWINLQSFLYPWGRTPHPINKWTQLVFS